MRQKRNEAKNVAKQDAIRQIAVCKIQDIQKDEAPNVAKQDVIFRRVDRVLEYLLWKEGVAKQEHIGFGMSP